MKKASHFRPDIEGLRAIAVILVVGFHASLPAFSGGFIGVDIFFVISGYLITSLLVRELETTGHLNLFQFYARRARRLLPAQGLTVVATLAAGVLLLSPLEQKSLAQAAAATSLYVSNIWFLRNAVDYFGGDAAINPLLHTWSLAVEEQFYLVWPLVILLAFRLGPSRRTLPIVIVSIFLISFICCAWLTKTNQPLAFFGTHTRAWQFALGGAASLVTSAKPASGSLYSWLGWVGLILVISSGVLFTADMELPGWISLIPTAGAACLLLSGAATRASAVTRFLSTTMMNRIGQLSYGWYLWHWPVLIFPALVYSHLDLFDRLLLALGSLLLAAITHALIEQPVRFSRYLVNRPIRTAAMAILIMSIGVTSAAMAAFLGRVASEKPQQAMIAQVASILPALYTKGCIADFTETKPRECSFSVTDSPSVVVLFGDSHAAQWFSPFEQMAKDHGWRLTTLIKSGCPSISVSVYNPRLQRINTECSVWREAALRRIAEIRPVLVVLANWHGYVGGDRGRGPSGRGYDHVSYNEWRDGARRTFEQLNLIHSPITILSDTPSAGFDVPTCLSRVANLQRGMEVCALSRGLALDHQLATIETDAAATYRNVSILDLTDHFCDRTDCPAVQNGIIVYRDSDHITDVFARSLLPVLTSKLVPLVAPK